MSIRTRLTIWFSGILGVSLLILTGVLYYEWEEQQHRMLQERKPPEPAWHEVGEIIVMFGLPTALLLVVGSSILLRKSLAPVSALTRAAESMQLDNLQQRLPVSGSGDEIDRLTEVFNAMMGRLENSFAHVREFTLHASHELKTPLTAMRASLESALEEETFTPPQREILAAQLEEIQRLTKIVNGLMFLAKADAGQTTLRSETLSFDELVRDVVSDLEMLARVQQIKVESEIGTAIHVRGDRHRLRQLLLNLVDNALKYNHPCGRVTTSLSQIHGEAVLHIANTGPGIPQEIAPRVFDRFFRGDAAHGSDVEGCGLGLSIVEWIAKAHGGSVAIQSPPGEMTTVTLKLPLVKSPRAS
jgi:signal transduction histidine kinase